MNASKHCGRIIPVLIISILLIPLSCEENPGSKTFGDPPTPETCFCDPDGIETYLEWAADEYPDIIQLRSIGMSESGRTIYAVKLSDNPETAEAEPAVLVNGAVHGNEQAGAGMALKLIEYLAEGWYIGDPDAAAIIENLELHIIPVINPDGLALSGRLNSNDVDLNRNFGYNWYTEEDNNGDSAFDQSESSAVRDDFLTQGYCLAVNMHTTPNYSGIGIYGPWDAFGTDTDSLTPDGWAAKYLPNYALIEQLGADYAADVTAEGIAPFKQYFHYLEGADWYPLYGSMTDWALGVCGTVSYSVELYPKQNYTTADADTLELIWSAQKAALLNLITNAELGTGGRLTDTSGAAVTGAVITLTAAASGRSFSPLPYDALTGRTDSDGYFRFITEAGDYHIKFVSGTRVGEADITVGASGETSIGGTYSAFPEYILPDA